MMSSSKAHGKYAIRVWINDPRQKKSILQRIDKARSIQIPKPSRSAFSLTAILEKADRLLAGQEGK